jgi:Trypsin-like peptidase domain
LFHNITKAPDFRDERPDSPIAQICMRVIIERADWKFEVIGSATLVCDHLAITAKHVLEHAIKKYGTTQKGNEIEIDGFEIKFLQILPGPRYRFWRLHQAWPCGTDIVFLHLAADRASPGSESGRGLQPRLRLLPPPVGQHVIAFGYRQGEVSVTESPDGTHHIKLDDKPTTSIGIVRQIYAAGRDRIMLPFPCFEVEARFDPGMSGGLVVDELGAVCGLICAGLHSEDANVAPISYVATLWPMLKTIISGGRGDGYPKDISYPAIDLAIEGQIFATDLELLDPIHFPGKTLVKRSDRP